MITRKYFEKEAEEQSRLLYANMMMKKVVSAVLASAMVVSTLPPAFAANNYPVSCHHAYMSGVGYGRFEPARHMTRAEAVVMLSRLYHNADGRGNAPTFIDTPANQWYSGYVGWAQAKGFLENTEVFRPDENITRAEYLDFLFRFQKLNAVGNTSVKSFSDLDGVNAATAAQIAHAVSKGWISGYADGTFRPNAAILRDEVTSMTNRAASRQPDKQHILKYLPSLITFSDVPATNWAYYDVLEACNPHNLYGTDANGEIWSVRQPPAPDQTQDEDGDKRYRIRAVDGDHGVVDGEKTFYTNRSGKITDLPEIEPDDGYIFVKWIDRKTEKRVKIGNILEKDITIEPVFERDSDDEDDINNSHIIRFTDGGNGTISDTSPRRTNRRGVVPSLPHVTPNDGYAFSKWINADTGRTIQAGDIIYSDIVLMPIFTVAGSSEIPPKEDNESAFTVSFVSGEHGDIDDMSPVQTEKDGVIAALPSTTAHEGYTFSQWVNHSTGEPVWTGDKLNGDITLRPVFVKLENENSDGAHTITPIDGDHGTLPDKSPVQTNPDGTISTFPDVIPDDGYELDKWVKVPGGEEVKPGDKLNDDATIQPVFKEQDNTHTITPTDGEHGSIPDKTPIQTDKHGVVDSLPEVVPGEGYTLDKWVKVPGGEEIKPGDKLDEDVTIQPVFTEQDNTHTVTPIDGEHGTAPDKTPIQTDKKGIVGTLPETAPDEGYSFDKWVKVPDGEEIRLGDKLDGDVTIQPIFKEQDNTHTITPVDGDHGSVPDKTPIQTDKHGVVDSLPEVVPDEGYTLDKWVKVPGGEEIKPGDKLDEDVTIQPVFTEQDNTHTVTPIDGEHGTAPDKTPIQTDKKGIIGTLPEAAPDEGYSFDKWVKVPDGEEIRPGDKLDGDVTIQPIFKEQDNTHTITLVDGDHGSVPDKTPIQTDKHGVVGSLPDAVSDEGYFFDKWINADTGEDVKTGDIVTENITIKPVFTEVPVEQYSIFFETANFYDLVDDTPVEAGEGNKFPVEQMPQVQPIASHYFDNIWINAETAEVIDKNTVLTSDITVKPQISCIFEAENGTVKGLSEYAETVDLTNITIPSNIMGEAVSEIGEDAFKARGNNATGRVPAAETIKNVVMEDGLKSIGNNAFSYSNLISVKLPNTLRSIGKNAFYSCDQLAEVKIPKSTEQLSESCFSICGSLKKVAFEPVSQLTEFPANVFAGCTLLTDIVIPNRIERINQYAFSNCSSLSDLVIPQSVASLGKGTFMGAGLTSIKIPNKITVLPELCFMNCNNLERVNIQGRVTEIKHDCFNRCGNLKSINLPDGLKTIGMSVFYYCTSLSRLDIPNSVTSMAVSSSFIKVPHIYYYGSYTDGAPWGADAMN